MTDKIGPIEHSAVIPKLSLSDFLSLRIEAAPAPSAMINGTLIGPVVTPPESNGIGLTNLSNRYRLLLGKEIRIEKTEGGGDGMFRVFLPMVKMNIKHTR